MAQQARGIWSSVLVAGLVSLLVTIVRVTGERSGWSELWFSAAAPGDPDKPQGLLGIGLLIPIFGCWFGWQLRRSTGEPARLGRAALVYLLGAVVVVGGFYACTRLGLLVMPTKAAPGIPQGMPWAAGLVGAAVLVMFTAWPRLSAVLFAYAVLARIPVIAVTYLSVTNGWDTHYDKLPQEFALPEGTDKVVFLSLPQVTFWIAVTMLFGGLFGCLGALLARRKA